VASLIRGSWLIHRRHRVAHCNVDQEVHNFMTPECPDVHYGIRLRRGKLSDPCLSPDMGPGLANAVGQFISIGVMALHAQWAAPATKRMIAVDVQHLFARVAGLLHIAASADRAPSRHTEAPLQDTSEVCVAEVGLLQAGRCSEALAGGRATRTQQPRTIPDGCARQQCIIAAPSQEAQHSTHEVLARHWWSHCACFLHALQWRWQRQASWAEGDAAIMQMLEGTFCHSIVHSIHGSGSLDIVSPSSHCRSEERPNLNQRGNTCKVHHLGWHRHLEATIRCW
jgi:hypothetical protein